MTRKLNYKNIQSMKMKKLLKILNKSLKNQNGID